MTYKEAREYLHPEAYRTPWYGYGAALSKAIEALEEAESLRAELRYERDRFDKLSDFELERQKMLERAKEDLRSASNRCEFCIQMTKPLLCLGSDYLCHECNQHSCVCMDCATEASGSGGVRMTYDITFCAYAGCPLKDCERHLKRLNDDDRPGKDGFSIADFAPT